MGSKKFCALFISMYVLFPVWGEEHSPALIAQNQNNTQQAATPVLPPDPLQLKLDWWNYFKVDKAQFKQRSYEMMRSLNEKIVQLNREQLQTAEPLIRKIGSGLNTLGKLEKKELSILVPTEKFKQTYTLSELKDLGLKLNENQKTLATLALQINLAKNNLRNDERFLDSLTLEYRAKTTPDFNRFIKGLEIIATKIAYEIESHQLQFSSFSYEEKKAQITTLENEIDYARNHLQLTADSLKDIEHKIQMAAEKLSHAHAHVDSMQYRLIQIQSNNQSSELMREGSAQQFLDATVLEGLALINLMNYNIEKSLVELRINQQKIDLSDLHQQIKTWNADLFKITREMSDWKKETELRLERVYREISKANGQRQQFERITVIADQTLINIQELENKKYLTDFLLDQLTILIREQYTTFWNKLADLWHQFVNFFRKHAKWFDTPFFKIGNTPFTLWGVIKFLLIIVISYLIAWITRRSIHRISRKKHRVSESGLYTLGRLVFYLIFFLGIIIAVTTVGIDFTAFAFIAGALSIGIGFGLQAIFNNFIAGIIVLLEKMIRIGDLVELESGEVGVVKAINVRTTVIRTYDNLEILIPNFEIISKKITNWTLSEKIRRVRVPFGVAFGIDKEKLRLVIIEAAKKVPTTLPGREPDVWFVKINESSLDFELIVWVNEYVDGLSPMATKSRYLYAIESALREYSIPIPYPVRDVFMQQKK